MVATSSDFISIRGDDPLELTLIDAEEVQCIQQINAIHAHGYRRPLGDYEDEPEVRGTPV